MMHKKLAIARIIVIAIGKIILASAVVSEIGLQQCQALNSSLFENPNIGIRAASCFLSI